MPAIVSKVLKGSIAEELDLASGDEIVSIDDTKMADMIDYNYLTKAEFLTLEVKKKDGEVEVIEIEKDFDDDLGIVFESAVFDKVKPCLNKCIFCFVDQQPKGLRDTLYIKDDDYRLSYLQGTYITLTNLNEKDKERIKSMRLGPFYVSVHTTNPELRVQMLRNPKAADIMQNLTWFRKNKIPFHAQIVLCPGYNDGEELRRTLSDLASLKNTVLSTAIVPVGVTKFRCGKLSMVDEQIAKETIKIASDFKRVCLSDEFFLLAGESIPPASYYGSFSQLEDGVGTLRMLIDDYKSLKLPKSLKRPHKFIFAASYAASSAVNFIAEDLMKKVKNLEIELVPVKSEYWGENITVAGLITSDDLINSLSGKTADAVVIPSVMLRPYSEDFLDGNSLNYVKSKLQMPFIVLNNNYSIKEFIDKLYNF